MYTPNERKLPSAFAAIIVAATMTFMTVAPEQNTNVTGLSGQTIASANTQSVCVERAVVDCQPIRA